MAKSKYEYVKGFELDDRCLPYTWMVVRLDGRGFHRFSTTHNFTKPNDVSALMLMNKAACTVLNEFHDIVIAYGQSDEFSFIFKRSMNLFGRRASKILSTVVSLFTSSYVFHWSEFISSPLQYPPSFDSRIIIYPDHKTVRDYLSWRQADCHINNLYNTCFWSLVQSGGLKHDEAERRLTGTDSSMKNDILFNEFGINYNNEPEQFKKGSVLMWESYHEKIPAISVSPGGESSVQTVNTKDVVDSKGVIDDLSRVVDDDVEGFSFRKRKRIVVLHVDIISDSFWDKNKYLLD